VIDEVADEGLEAPIWPAFGDLMACLFGLFVLFFVSAVALQADLSAELRSEKSAREVEGERLAALERALAAPLANGTITLVDGAIGIRGNVLFASSSSELRPEGAGVLRQLAGPLRAFVDGRGEVIMVSGFTDDYAPGPNALFKDNLELSAARALTVARALFAAGLPQEKVFAAGFGAVHPVATNATPEGRARNRRVEIAPVPPPRRAGP